jgi:hypothetical protein
MYQKEGMIHHMQTLSSNTTKLLRFLEDMVSKSANKSNSLESKILGVMSIAYILYMSVTYILLVSSEYYYSLWNISRVGIIYHMQSLCSRTTSTD